MSDAADSIATLQSSECKFTTSCDRPELPPDQISRLLHTNRLLPGERAKQSVCGFSTLSVQIEPVAACFCRIKLKQMSAYENAKTWTVDLVFRDLLSLSLPLSPGFQFSLNSIQWSSFSIYGVYHCCCITASGKEEIYEL